MVLTDFNQNTCATTIVLKPNNSASWRFNMVVVSTLAFIAFCISTYFALQGLWLVFPFSGLEISLLVYCLYVRLKANIATEVITFNDDTVLVERGYNYAEKSWKYPRLWAKIFVKAPPFRGYPKRVFIRSHGKELELGSFLNKKDKERLIRDLKNAVYC